MKYVKFGKHVVLVTDSLFEIVHMCTYVIIFLRTAVQVHS